MDSPRPNQVGWGGALKPPPVEPTVYADISQPMKMVDVDTEDLG